jgi:hypothetical protein
MSWQKCGLIFNPDGSQGPWAEPTKGFLTPQPFLLNPETIRIYGGFRCKEGVSRIGFIDVSAKNPKEVLKVSQTPVLDIGTPGMFDDNGVILGDIIRVEDEIWMYYVGFQIPKHVKFMAFSGLAISRDNGETFQRFQKTPILDRTAEAPFLRAIHTILPEKTGYRCWYAVGDGWEMINNILYPRYYIQTTTSPDGKNFPEAVGKDCILPEGREYRIGRPKVSKQPNGHFDMRFTYDTLDKHYRAGYATSPDGIDWCRDDKKLGLDLGPESWDSESLCYPVVLDTDYAKYCFYSGNNMGSTGVGYAIWRGE